MGNQSVAKVAASASKKAVISVDLGGDTCKVVCAYKDKSGKPVVLKVIEDGFFDIAIPAVACYDNGNWYFGYEVGSNNNASFEHVVKIKDMLSILFKLEENDKNINGIFSRCKKYYREGYKSDTTNKRECAYYFPKFTFPKRIFDKDNCYALRENGKLGFNYAAFCEDSKYAPYRFKANCSPKTVCEGFFEYVAKLTKSAVDNKSFNCNLAYDLIVTYPYGYKSDYKDEYERLVCEAFENVLECEFDKDENSNFHIISSAMALAHLAKIKGNFNEDESALFFDIGEEHISVVKTKAVQNKDHDKIGYYSEDAKGHSATEYFGGNDIDKAIGAGLEQVFKQGSINVNEKSLISKEYLFYKNVKTAKHLLCAKNQQGQYFNNSALVSTVRELEIFTDLTADRLNEFIGISNSDISGISARIVEYVKNELKRTSNNDVTKVFLSGGVIATRGLVDAIRKAVKTISFGGVEKEIELITFDNISFANHTDLTQSDMNTYAPAVSGALISLDNMWDSFGVILTKSYGIRLFKVEGSTHIPYLQFLANKGDILQFDEKGIWRHPLCVFIGYENKKLYDSSADMSIYSINIAEGDVGNDNLAECCFEFDNQKWLSMDDDKTKAILKKKFGLENITSVNDMGTMIQLFVNEKGNKIRIKLDTKIYISIGIEIDKDLNVIGFVNNAQGKNHGHKYKIYSEYDDVIDSNNEKEEIDGENIIVEFQNQLTGTAEASQQN